jgi:hypothetical protein
MAGEEDVDAQPLADRDRRDGYRPRHMRRPSPEDLHHDGDGADDVEGPDEAELEAVTRLMGFLRSYEPPA